MTKRRVTSRRGYLPISGGPLARFGQRNSRLTARCRLRLEPLEARRLLAGLQVSVFVDHDVSRSFDASVDSKAESRLVFIDSNFNGAFEFGEPIRVTDQNGRALFEDLAEGDYSLGILANPISQWRTTAVHVAPNATRELTTPVDAIIADVDLHQIWTVDEFGVARRLVEPLQVANARARAAGPGQPIVDLGGRVIDSLVSGDRALLLTRAPDHPETELMEFDLVTGNFSAKPLIGLYEGESLRQIDRTANATIALVQAASGGETRVVELQFGPQVVQVSEGIKVSASQITGSPVRSDFALVTANRAGSRVALYDSRGGVRSFLDLGSFVDSIQFSGDGERLLVTTVGSGVSVLSLRNGQLALEAVLAEAAGPVAASLPDGRVITGRRDLSGKLTLWDERTWLPVGSTRLSSNLGKASGQLLVDRYGDVALLANANGLYSVDLSVPHAVRALVQSGANSSVEMGVRLFAQNNAPEVFRFTAQAVTEDVPRVFRFDGPDGIVDPDGDQLWFTLATSPMHGKVSVNASGEWVYTPNRNFNGSDSAVFLVHDGIASTELALQWEIEPVNDPPIAIHIQLPPLTENPTPGTSIGFISVADPDANPHYRVTTSDPRFRISGGQIYFVDGKLDFDVEPNIAFEVVATDVQNPEYSISTEAFLRLTNVDEPPTALKFISTGISENVVGGIVGALSVVDPDADSGYQYEISDDRFEVQNGFLRLIDGEKLDHETEPSVQLRVTARESGKANQAITEEISFPVINENEAPTGLFLSSREVEADTRGAVVGELAVFDPDGDHYGFSVTDERFEVIDNVLKLQDDVQLEQATLGLRVTVSASSPSGDTISDTFPIIVVPPRSPHQNHANPHDVNGDGIVSPLDALELINELNNGGGGVLPPRSGGSIDAGTGEAGLLPDVNGDGALTPIDVLWLINELNVQNRGSEGEGPLNSPMAFSHPSPMEDLQRRKQQNSKIDAEIELLLEELSRHRAQ